MFVVESIEPKNLIHSYYTYISGFIRNYENPFNSGLEKTKIIDWIDEKPLCLPTIVSMHT